MLVLGVQLFFSDNAEKSMLRILNLRYDFYLYCVFIVCYGEAIILRTVLTVGQTNTKIHP